MLIALACAFIDRSINIISRLAGITLIWASARKTILIAVNTRVTVI